MNKSLTEIESEFGRVKSFRNARKDDRNRVVIGRSKYFEYEVYQFETGEVLLIPSTNTKTTKLEERKLFSLKSGIMQTE